MNYCNYLHDNACDVGDCTGPAADTNAVGDGRSILREYFGGSVTGRSFGRDACTDCSLPATPCTRSMRDRTKVNRSFAVGNSHPICDSNEVRHDADKHRDASEKRIKSPKSGTSSAVKTETPSPNTVMNLFKSEKLSTDDTGTFNKSSTYAPATKRGLSKRDMSADPAKSNVAPEIGIPRITSAATP